MGLQEDAPGAISYRDFPAGPLILLCFSGIPRSPAFNVLAAGLYITPPFIFTW